VAVQLFRAFWPLCFGSVECTRETAKATQLRRSDQLPHPPPSTPNIETLNILDTVLVTSPQICQLHSFLNSAANGRCGTTRCTSFLIHDLRRHPFCRFPRFTVLKPAAIHAQTLTPVVKNLLLHLRGSPWNPILHTTLVLVVAP
jgi:hypothetical protein